MSEVAVFTLLLVTVVAIGGWWLVRGALTRSRTPDDDPDDPVAIAGSLDEMSAEVLRSKLEALGVRAFTRNRLGRTFPGGIPPILLGWEVLVRRADADQAGMIIVAEPEAPAP